MQKQILKLVIAFLFVLTIVGASSAANTVDTSSIQYQVGSQVTDQALSDTGSEGLNLQTSDVNLLITNAGSALLNGESTQDSVQAVVDKTSNINPTSTDAREITYGSGNLLTINDPNGQLEFTLVSNTAGVLMAKKFIVSQTGTITNSKTVNIGTAQTQQDFQKAIAALGSNGFAIANIANLWAAGAPADLMASTFTTGNINQGTIDNYAMTRSFALTYPTASTGGNYVITHAGGRDDDALIYGPFGFSDILSSTSSGSNDETVFINYNTVSDQRSGILALMSRNDLTSAYGSVVAGSLSEIKFNLYLLNLLNTNPYALFTVEQLKTVTETNIQHLWYDPTVGYGYGIDKDYITGLPDALAPAWASVIVPDYDATTYTAMYNLGQQAVIQAQTNLGYTGTPAEVEAAFRADIAAGNIAVVLAPYYVNLMGTMSFAGLIDGIASVYPGFNINNILSIRNPWTWGSNTANNFPILFVKVDPTSSANYALSHDIDSLVINSVKVTATVSGYDAFGTPSFTTAVTKRDISPTIFSTIPKSYVIPAVAGINYAWAANAPNNFIRTIARVGCICSAREYDAAMNSMGMSTLGANEHYILIALTQFNAETGLASETNRQISGRTTAYGVSPSQSTYYQAQNSNGAYDSILIRWNDATHTGTAALISFNSDSFNAAPGNAGYSTYNEENTMFYHLDRVFNGGPDAALVASYFTIARAIPINSAILSTLTAAGGDPVKFILNYVVPVTPATPTSSQGTSGNSLVNIGGTISSALNGLGTSSTSTNEIAPGLPLGQSTPATATTTNSSTAGLPIGAIIGALFLVIAAILVYLGRNTIIETIGYGGPGK